MLTLGPRTLETWMFYHTGILLSYCSHRRPLGVNLRSQLTCCGGPCFGVLLRRISALTIKKQPHGVDLKRLSKVIQICGAMVWEQRDPRIPCASTHKPCMRELVSLPSPLITVATPPQLSRFQAHQDRTKSGVPSCHATPCTKTIELLMRIGAYTHFRP